MLKELHIRNYALFQNAQIRLGPNFNVFTGETGAGKSLLVGAMGLLLGNKSTTTIIRSGAEETEVIGLFSIAAQNKEARAWLQKHEIPLELEQEQEQERGNEEKLSVRRILKSNGKNSCYIQHIPVSRSKLAEFMSLVLDLHSQHQNQSLFHSRQQLRMLDQYASLQPQVETLAKNFQEINHRKKLLAEAKAAVSQRAEKTRYLEEAIAEISALKPQENEDTQLSERIELLSNAESIRIHLEETIESGSLALTQLNQCQTQLDFLSGKIPATKELLNRLQSASIEVEDILDSCKSEKYNLEFNPRELQELDQRLSQLILLNRKYSKTSLKETLEFREEAEARLSSLENSEEAVTEQEKAIQVAEKQLIKDAYQLSQQRKKYAQLLEKSIEEKLHKLGMLQAKFRIELKHSNNEDGQILCQSYGIDKIRFMLAANPGEELHEIQQVASGGEISRIMLAIKSEPANKIEAQIEAKSVQSTEQETGIESIIFDEIDTGTGGETGVRLAEYIHQLGRHQQVLCVTHLASIAASANTHLKIEKISEIDSTKVEVVELNTAQRCKELARMLSGESENPTSLAHAQELLSRYS